jgi:DNA replication factor GINS
VNLEELRDRRQRERQHDSLQPLPESFYRDAADYLADLTERREAVAAEASDPYGDPQVRRLTDELQSARSIVESLYERRVGKVVKHASFAAADMPHDREGLTDEEDALFDDLVARIGENRSRVLGPLDGEGARERTETEGSPAADGRASPRAESTTAETPVDGAASEPADTPDPADAGTADDPAGMLAEAMGDGSSAEPPDPGDDEATEDRTTVRITADVGEIYGVDDRSYRLAPEDVVDLPADNARPLIEKEAAERL